MRGQKMLLMCIPSLKSTDPTGQEQGHWNQAFSIASQTYNFMFAKEMSRL